MSSSSSCSLSSSSSHHAHQNSLLLTSLVRTFQSEFYSPTHRGDGNALFLKVQAIVNALLDDEQARPYAGQLDAIRVEISQFVSSTFKRRRCDLNFFKIITFTDAIFINISKGTFNKFPLVIQTYLCSWLHNKDLGSLASVSHGCKDLAYSDGVWSRQVTELGLTSDEISAAGRSCRGAVRAAHIKFYQVLFNFLTERVGKTDQKTLQEDSQIWSQPNCIQKFRKCLEERVGGIGKRQLIDLSNNYLTFIPGWVWSFFPLVDKIVLTGNRIKALPPQILRLKLQFLDCSQNQLEQLPSILSKMQIEELYLTGNKLSSVPAALTLMAEGSFVSFSLNPKLPLSALLPFKAEREDMRIEQLIIKEEHASSGKKARARAFERTSNFSQLRLLVDAMR